MGMGAAVQTGCKNSSYDFIADIPADGQYPPNQIQNLINSINGYDIVVGYINESFNSLLRKVFSFANILITRVLFGLNLKKPTCVKLFRRSILENVKIKSSGFFWEVEILARARKFNYKMTEALVHVIPREKGVSKAASLKSLFRITIEMFKFWWKEF